MKRAYISWIMVLPFFISANFAAGDLVLGPTKGEQYDRPDSASSLISSKGQITTPSSPPNTVDTQPPTIQIEAPTVVPSGGVAIIQVSVSDDVGLFRVGSEPVDTPGIDCDEGCEHRMLFSGERDASIEYSLDLRWAFGRDATIGAYVTDLAGNSATATHSIISEEQIQAGKYTLENPISEQLSGEGCGFNFEMRSFEATALNVYGYYSEFCDPNDTDEIQNPHACLAVYTSSEPDNGSFGNWGHVTVAMSSPSDTFLSKDQLTLEESHYLDEGGNYYAASHYNLMEIEFLDTSPPAVQASITLRCEDPVYGTTEWGPFMMYGVLEE